MQGRGLVFLSLEGGASPLPHMCDCSPVSPPTPTYGLKYGYIVLHKKTNLGTNYENSLDVQFVVTFMFLTGHCPLSHPISFDKKRWCCKERQRSSTCGKSGKLEINDTIECCDHPIKCGMSICKDANGEINDMKVMIKPLLRFANFPFFVF